MFDPREQGTRQKVIRVDRRLLADILKLPAGTRITGVSDQRFMLTDEIAIKVENPSFALVPPSCELPECRPMYSEIRSVVFDGWGQDDRFNG